MPGFLDRARQQGSQAGGFLDRAAAQGGGFLDRALQQRMAPLARIQGQATLPEGGGRRIWQPIKTGLDILQVPQSVVAQATWNAPTAPWSPARAAEAAMGGRRPGMASLDIPTSLLWSPFTQQGRQAWGQGWQRAVAGIGAKEGVPENVGQMMRQGMPMWAALGIGLPLDFLEDPLLYASKMPVASAAKGLQAFKAGNLLRIAEEAAPTLSRAEALSVADWAASHGYQAARAGQIPSRVAELADSAMATARSGHGTILAPMSDAAKQALSVGDMMGKTEEYINLAYRVAGAAAEDSLRTARHWWGLQVPLVSKLRVPLFPASTWVSEKLASAPEPLGAIWRTVTTTARGPQGTMQAEMAREASTGPRQRLTEVVENLRAYSESMTPDARRLVRRADEVRAQPLRQFITDFSEYAKAPVIAAQRYPGSVEAIGRIPSAVSEIMNTIRGGAGWADAPSVAAFSAEARSFLAANAESAVRSAGEQASQILTEGLLQAEKDAVANRALRLSVLAEMSPAKVWRMHLTEERRLRLLNMETLGLPAPEYDALLRRLTAAERVLWRDPNDLIARSVPKVALAERYEQFLRGTLAEIGQQEVAASVIEPEKLIGGYQAGVKIGPPPALEDSARAVLKRDFGFLDEAALAQTARIIEAIPQRIMHEFRAGQKAKFKAANVAIRAEAEAKIAAGASARQGAPILQGAPAAPRVPTPVATPAPTVLRAVTAEELISEAQQTLDRAIRAGAPNESEAAFLGRVMAAERAFGTTPARKAAIKAARALGQKAVAQRQDAELRAAGITEGVPIRIAQQEAAKSEKAAAESMAKLRELLAAAPENVPETARGAVAAPATAEVTAPSRAVGAPAALRAPLRPAAARRIRAQGEKAIRDLAAEQKAARPPAAGRDWQLYLRTHPDDIVKMLGDVDPGRLPTVLSYLDHLASRAGTNLIPGWTRAGQADPARGIMRSILGVGPAVPGFEKWKSMETPTKAALGGFHTELDPELMLYGRYRASVTARARKRLADFALGYGLPDGAGELRQPARKGWVTLAEAGAAKGLTEQQIAISFPELTVVPLRFNPDVANLLLQTREVKFTDPGLSMLGRAWYWGLRNWKGGATVANNAWAMVNIQGMIVNNFIRGVRDPRLYIVGMAAAAEHPYWQSLLRNAARKIAPDLVDFREGRYFLKTPHGALEFEALHQAGIEHGIHSGWHTAALERQAPASFLAQAPRFPIPPKILNRANAASNFFSMDWFGYYPTRVISEGSEEAFRHTLWLHRLVNGDTLPEGARIVRDTHFDYGELTSTERALRGGAFPFYTWMRKNPEFQIGMLLQDPGTAALTPKIVQALNQRWQGQERLDSALLSPWQDDTLTVQFTPAGDPSKPPYVGVVRLPVMDLDTLTKAQDLLAALGPAKVPLELVMNKSIFTGQPISRAKEHAMPGTDWAYEDWEPAPWWAALTPRWMQIGGVIAPGLDPETGEPVMYMTRRFRYAIEGLVPQVGQASRWGPAPGQAIPTDQRIRLFGRIAVSKEAARLNAIRLATGMTIRPVDEEKRRQALQRQQTSAERGLQGQLQQRGLAPQRMQRPSIPIPRPPRP